MDNLFSDKKLFDNNGGDTLSLFDFTKISHSRRVFGMRKKIKKKINLEDIDTAMNILKNKKKSLDKLEPPYGMYV